MVARASSSPARTTASTRTGFMSGSAFREPRGDFFGRYESRGAHPRYALSFNAMSFPKRSDLSIGYKAAASCRLDRRLLFAAENIATAAPALDLAGNFGQFLLV